MFDIALAYFIMWATRDTTLWEFDTSRTIYERYYDWELCDFQDYWTFENTPVRDCNQFFLLFDNENLQRARYRKQTLLREYSKQFYNLK